MFRFRFLVRNFFPIIVLIPIMAGEVKGKCPEPSRPIADDTCVYVKPLHADNEDEIDEASHSMEHVQKHCDKLKMGDLVWTLPRVDTGEKYRRFSEILNQTVGEKKNSPQTVVWFVWLSMHKRESCNSDDRDKCFYWTDDNSTITFGETGLESNWGSLGFKDHDTDDDADCVAMYKKIHEPDWKLAKLPCKRVPPSPNNDETAEPKNSTDPLGEFCTSKMKPSQKSDSATSATPTTSTVEPKVLDQWWFYFICAVLLVVPMIAVVIVFVVLFLMPNRRKSRQSKSERRRRRGRRISSTRASPDERRKKKKRRGSPDSENDGHSATFHTSRSKKMLTTPVDFTVPRPSSGTESSMDEEDHIYSNPRGPRHTQPKESIRIVKKSADMSKSDIKVFVPKPTSAKDESVSHAYENYQYVKVTQFERQEPIKKKGLKIFGK